MGREKMIDVTVIDKTIEGTITDPTTDKIMEEAIKGNKDMEPEVKVGTILEIPKILTEIIQGKDLSKVEI